jgi:hypothetical protein
MSRGSSEKKEHFKNKCDSGMCWAYFVAYGVIESISMSAFVEGALALDLPLSKRYVFPNLLICLFIVLLSYLQVPFIRFQAIASLLWDWGEHRNGRAHVWTGF